MIFLFCYVNIWQMVWDYVLVGRQRALSHLKTIQGNNPKLVDIVASLIAANAETWVFLLHYVS